MNFSFAAPSYVRPGTISDNCRFLSGLVPEVGLLFFETTSCLGYGEHDLPKELADFPLNYHAHLPLDLPWEEGGAAVAGIADDLASKIDFLSPRTFVLHPPQDPIELARFVTGWVSRGRLAEKLLLENIKGNDLTILWPHIPSLGCRVCLDLGHLLAYGQQATLNIHDLWPLVGMVHLSAPGNHGEHAALAELNSDNVDLLESILIRIPTGTTLMIEIFEERSLLSSLRWLEKLIQKISGQS